MPLGGRRAGSGRKPGVSKTTLLKRKFQDYFDEKEVKNIIRLVKEQAKEKPELLKLIVEQLFGKAPQRMQITGKDGESLVLNLVKYGDNPVQIPTEKVPDPSPEIV